MDKADYEYSLEKLIPGLRIFHPKNDGSWPQYGRLQQLFEITYFKNGVGVGGELEWRDIPEVKEE